MPDSVTTAIVGLMVSAIVSAFALWLGLSPYRKMYADDPEGKRSRTLKRDAELVDSLWWDAVFYFVAWIVLGIVAALLLGNMGLLTAHQGALLGLFFLVTIPLIAVCESGGTAHRHLKAAWVEPLREITRKILVYGLCLFGLIVIYGTLNWYERTWVELLRTKGGILFELGYVAVVSTALWLGFRATWRKLKIAWAANDERQEVVRKVTPKTNANRAQGRPKPKRAKARAKILHGSRKSKKAEEQPSPQEPMELEAGQEAVIVGFYILPSATPGTRWESPDMLYGVTSRLRKELRLPDANVFTFDPNQWGAPPIEVPDQIHDRETLQEITEAASKKLRQLRCTRSIVAQVSDGVFKNLIFPSSGRVLLFCKLVGPSQRLGRLGRTE